MCGSGTFLIEAALMATNVAPGSFRRWWPFTQVGAKQLSAARARQPQIRGSMVQSVVAPISGMLARAYRQEAAWKRVLTDSSMLRLKA